MESGSHNTQRDAHVERLHRRHLAVREGPELHDLAKRYAARALGGVRLRAAVWPRQGARERRRRRRQRARQRLAAQHHLQVPVGRADVLPVGLLQRARSVPCGCIPAITNADAVFAQDKGSFDPARGRCSTRTRSRRSAPSTTTSAPATASKRASAASRTQNQDFTLMKNTRMAGARTSSSGSRCSTCGTGTRSSAGGVTMAWPGVQHRHYEPGFRQVEWRRDRPAQIQLGVRFEF